MDFLVLCLLLRIFGPPLSSVANETTVAAARRFESGTRAPVSGQTARTCRLRPEPLARAGLPVGKYPTQTARTLRAPPVLLLCP